MTYVVNQHNVYAFICSSNIFILFALRRRQQLGKQKLTSALSSTLPPTFKPRHHKMWGSLFLISGTVLDQPCEFEVIEVAGIVTLLFVEHLRRLFRSEPLSHRHKETFKFVTVDHTRLLWIETLECVLDDIFGVGTVELSTEEREEGGEVEIGRRLLDHVFEVRLWRILSHGGEHTSKIRLRDEAVTILIDHVERFLELLDLLLREQSEDVGGGLLGLLLCGALLLAHG